MAKRLPKYTTKNWEKIGPVRFSDAAKDPQRTGHKDTGRRASSPRKRSVPGGYSKGGSVRAKLSSGGPVAKPN